MSEAERMASMHMGLPNGATASAGRALLTAARELPGSRRLAGVALKSPIAVRWTEAGYRLVAENRKTLGTATRER
jgi:predicted DCC family thiol-disulfide oxidoreductase YuxK